MMKHRFLFPFLFLALMLPAPPAASAGDTTYSGAYTLEDVVVSTERDKHKVESVSTVREITAQDIEVRNARTLDEAIKMLPGIHVRTGGQGTPRIDLRGFKPRHVLLLLDGVPLNSTFDGQFDPSSIPAENIDTIRVTYSNSSVLYGQGGLGGVINIVTKRGSQGLHGSVTEEAGEQVDHYGKFSLSGGRNNVTFFLSGSDYKSDSYTLSRDFKATKKENGGLRENSDRERKNVFAKVSYTPSERWLLGFTFSGNQGEYGIPSPVIDDTSDPFLGGIKYRRVNDYRGYSLQLSANYDAPGPLELKSWFSYNKLDKEESQYDDNQYNSMDDIHKKGTYHQESTTSITSLNLQANYDLDKFGSFTIALAGEKQSWEADGRIRDKLVAIGGVDPWSSSGGGGGGGGGTKTYFMRPIATNRDLKIYSTAFEYEVSPFEPLTIVLGYASYTLKKDDGGSEHEPSFLAGAQYKIFSTTKLHAAISRKIRFPSISQLYDVTKGNIDLQTEKAWNHELGIVQKLPGNSSLSLTGFYIRSKDFIQKDPGTRINENRDKARFKGFEIAGETRFLKGLVLRGNYTFMHTKDCTEDSGYDELQYTPRDNLSLEAIYSFDFGLQLYASLLHINREYHYSKKAPYSKQKLPQYTLIDVKVSQRLFKDTVELYAGANNLFDKNYSTSYGLPQAGQFLYAGIKVGF